MPFAKKARPKSVKLINVLALLVVGGLLIMFPSLFSIVGFAGSSMYPTINGASGQTIASLFAGDRLLIRKYNTWLYKQPNRLYQRGDVVLFQENLESPCRMGKRALLIKRLIGLPGDHVVVDADGNVMINETMLEQNFIASLPSGGVGPNFRPADLVVPAEEYFVLGDNRVNSCDSRIYGTIPASSMIGEAVSIIWPPRRNGSLNWQDIRLPEAFLAIPNP